MLQWGRADPNRSRWRRDRPRLRLIRVETEHPWNALILTVCWYNESAKVMRMLGAI